MIAYEPTTVCSEFISKTLKADAGVTALLAAEVIRPQFYFGEEPDQYVTHRWAGPDGASTLTLPIGKPPAMVRLRWQVTAWTKALGDQALRPLGKAIIAALTGSDMAGKSFPSFVDSDSVGWAITVLWAGPALVRPEEVPEGVWQQVSAYYQVDMRQKG